MLFRYVVIALSGCVAGLVSGQSYYYPSAPQASYAAPGSQSRVQYPNAPAPRTAQPAYSQQQYSQQPQQYPQPQYQQYRQAPANSYSQGGYATASAAPYGGVAGNADPAYAPRAARTVSADGSALGVNRPIGFPSDPGDDVEVLKLQIFLDYHGYSAGEIDGKWGYNTERSLVYYKKNNGMTANGGLDQRTIERLNSFQDGYLLEYTLTEKDVSGPFFTIPRSYQEQADMKWLPYESLEEMLGEKFHCSQSLIRKLNPQVDFRNVAAGTKILGLNVVNGIDDKRGKVSTVRVSKTNKWIEAFDADGNFMFYYPCTVGHNDHDPLPIGNYSITQPVHNPEFKYQPKLFYDADPNEAEEMIPPGPNSPVGQVWIGTTRKSVGLHGTPNPENISKNVSHGCIRMANWDAKQLAGRVSNGVKLEFVN